MKIRVLVDGVEISIPVLNDVKVIVDFDEEEADDTSIHHTFTYEGVISDLIEAGEVVGTDCQMYEEIHETLASYKLVKEVIP